MRLILFFATSLFIAACGSSGNQTEETTAETTLPEEPSLSVDFQEQWATDTVLRTPESVLYDEVTDMIFVANIGAFNKDSKDGDGFISVLAPDGIVDELNWVEGLNDPKGMGVFDGKLYVSDLDEVVEISIADAEILNKYPIEGATFLNDITINGQGQVYVSDSDNDKIHMIEGGQPMVWLEDSTLQRPNGLLADGNQMLLASAGGGFLAPIDLDSKQVQDTWLEGIPSADGIIKTPNGDYIVSTWQGEVHYVAAESGQTIKLLDTKAEEINAADIGYIPQQNLLLVPTFRDHRVVAYKVTAN
ncbi:gluconolaconase [Tunicatimonas pelagia]|uniref:gluconolaconase n=1 Tax=Tunicatimonas pelagia TaxID=931531 RepID=UPI00266635C6|nr:gluconolaconase [Tunicatimonas pelagia]WKN46148.1 gluconolaconase [Tunicatimonas pelagia]